MPALLPRDATLTLPTGSQRAGRRAAPTARPINARGSLIVNAPAPPSTSRGTARPRRPRARPRTKMATAMYLEHYLDSIENLPCELQRNFQLMRELDQRTEDKKAEIDTLAAEYIASVRALSAEQRVAHLQRIQSAYSRCKEYSDDKVQLAMQTYEMVDKHIRRLDADLARFEADLKDKMEGSDFESSGARGLKKGRGQKEKRGSRGRGRRTSEEDTPKKKKHKGGSEFTDTILSVHPSDVLDMPVDPNEPTYCLCHQVSYGEMIGCDNPDCPIEWFHFACVDLTTKPKGKWFCPRCVQERRRKK